MEIKNEALLKMLDSASKLKKQKELELKEEDKSLIENLPSIQQTTKHEVAKVKADFTPSLSLNPDQPITRHSLLSNVGVGSRVFKEGLKKL